MLNETLRIYRLIRPRCPLSEILVTGELAGEKGVVEGIARATALKTSLWRPFDSVRWRGKKLENDLQARLSVPLGLAVCRENGTCRGFDLRRGAFAGNVNGKIKGPILCIFAALMLLAGLWTWHIFQMLHIEEHKHGKLAREIQTVFTQTFPHANTMVKGQEAVQMRQSLDEAKRKFRWLNQAMAEGRVLESLLSLTRSISGFSDVRVENIFVEGRVVHVDGRTSSFNTVDTLKGKLSDIFGGARLVGAKMDKRESAVMFTFVLENHQ